MLSSWDGPQSSGNKGGPTDGGLAFRRRCIRSILIPRNPEFGDGPKKAQVARCQKEEIQNFNQKNDPPRQGTTAAEEALARPEQ